MKIIILSQYFESPDQPGLTLLSSMAEHFAADHQVTIICGRYIRMGRRRAPEDRIVHASYTVRRIWSGGSGKRGLRSRFLNFMAFSLSSVWALARTGKVDVIYASSPPIFPVFPALLWARLTGAKFILEICDLWPESAIALGLIHNKRLIAWTSALEAFLFRHSDGIVALTHGIAEWIQKWHRPKVPLIVARCAVSSTQFSQAVAVRETVRLERQWTDKCIAIFAGTIGYAQDIETLLQAADHLKDHKNLRIVVMGDGVYRGKVASAALELKNIELLAPRSKIEAMNILAAADIGLCTLKDRPLFNGALPTKLVDYLAANLPVVAPDLTEIRTVVSSLKAGLLYRAGDAASLAQALRDLADGLLVPTRHSSLPEEFTLEYRNLTVQRFGERIAGQTHQALESRSGGSAVV